MPGFDYSVGGSAFLMTSVLRVFEIPSLQAGDCGLADFMAGGVPQQAPPEEKKDGPGGMPLGSVFLWATQKGLVEKETKRKPAIMRRPGASRFDTGKSVLRDHDRNGCQKGALVTSGEFQGSFNYGCMNLSDKERVKAE